MEEILTVPHNPMHIQESTVESSHEASSFDIMALLRIVFYLIVLLKIIELSFLRKKKHSLKERIYRKFIYTHQ